MNNQKLLQRRVSFTLVALFLIGCSAPVATPLVITEAPVTAYRTEAPAEVAPTEGPATLSPTGLPAPASAVVIPPMPTVQFGGEHPVVQLTNKLGVEATIEVGHIAIKDPILSSVAASNYSQEGHELVITIADGVYLIVPLRMVRRAYASGEGHIVTLADGQELKGRLNGELGSSELLASDRKRYDLSTASTLVLISLPTSDDIVEPSSQQSEIWQLHIPKPLDLTYTVSNPTFYYEYYSTEGYVIGGEMRTTQSTSFVLKVGNEEIPTNLADFEEISFSKVSEDKPSQIKVRAKSGVETVGTLGLSISYYPSAGDIYLVMDFTDSEMAIALKNPLCTLSKISK